MSQQAQQDFLTADEVSARWKQIVTVGTLANWRAKKPKPYGPSFCKLGGRVLYPLAAVQAFEAANTVLAAILA